MLRLMSPQYCMLLYALLAPWLQVKRAFPASHLQRRATVAGGTCTIKGLIRVSDVLNIVEQARRPGPLAHLRHQV
jgi:hypothetical protein